MPGWAGLSCRSNAVVFAAFCSSPVNRARLSVNVSAMRNSMSLYLEYLHHLVAQVIDDFHGDAARLRFLERSCAVAVQRGPGFGVDLGFQCGLEGAVRVVRAKE